MHILAVGISHTSAPVQLRERLAFSEGQICSALSDLACRPASGSMSEAVILSTCNRTEIYAVSNQVSFPGLEFFLSAVPGCDSARLAAYLYRFQDEAAARHLFSVAAGLDSMVVGEPQILGQVARALELARGRGTAGPVLNRLFQSAIHAGKRARAETGISRNPASVSSLAATLSERVVQKIAEARIVILGAGEMAELAVEALRKRGASRILVINRTLERARTLARRWNAQAGTFDNIPAALLSADILIASTSAPHTILSYDTLSQVMQTRCGRPLVLIDIAVPRDIAPEAASIPGVQLYDMDGLSTQLEHALAERISQVPQVKIIVEAELHQLVEYIRSLEMLPVIAGLRQQAEDIRRRELDRTLRRMPGLTAAERDRIAAMTEALVKKILDTPIQRLRAEAACPQASNYAAVARALFGLQIDGPGGVSSRTPAASTAADRRASQPSNH